MVVENAILIEEQGHPIRKHFDHKFQYRNKAVASRDICLFKQDGRR